MTVLLCVMKICYAGTFLISVQKRDLEKISLLFKNKRPIIMLGILKWPIFAHHGYDVSAPVLSLDCHLSQTQEACFCLLMCLSSQECSE